MTSFFDSHCTYSELPFTCAAHLLFFGKFSFQHGLIWNNTFIKIQNIFPHNMLNQFFLNKDQYQLVNQSHFQLQIQNNSLVFLSLIHIAVVVSKMKLKIFLSNMFIRNNMFIRFPKIFLTTLLLGLHGYSEVQSSNNFHWFTE